MSATGTQLQPVHRSNLSLVHSLRTLCRALRFASSLHCSNIARSLYEVRTPCRPLSLVKLHIISQGLCMSFVSQVTRDQHCIVESVCQKHLNLSSDVIRAPLPHPKSAGWVKVEGYWVEAGSLAPATPPGYVLTPSVRDNLAKLSRIISGRWDWFLCQLRKVTPSLTLTLLLLTAAFQCCYKATPPRVRPA